LGRSGLCLKEVAIVRGLWELGDCDVNSGTLSVRDKRVRVLNEMGDCPVSCHLGRKAHG